ncbi:SCO family protein [Kaarinaea lacus]
MALNRGQKQFLLLALVFFAPMLIAFLLVQNMGLFGEFSRKNHGELIQPARLLNDIELTDGEGGKFSFSQLRGKWLLVYVGSSSCDVLCQENLYKMRQARLSQGGELKRIERLYVSTNGKPDADFAKILKAHEGMQLVYTSDMNSKNLMQQFELSQAQIQQESFGLFIIDPLGNLMMRYPTGYEAKGLAKDLALLLKASFAG